MSNMPPLLILMLIGLLLYVLAAVVTYVLVGKFLDRKTD